MVNWYNRCIINRSSKMCKKINKICYKTTKNNKSEKKTVDSLSMNGKIFIVKHKSSCNHDSIEKHNK